MEDSLLIETYSQLLLFVSGINNSSEMRCVVSAHTYFPNTETFIRLPSTFHTLLKSSLYFLETLRGANNSSISILGFIYWFVEVESIDD